MPRPKRDSDTTANLGFEAKHWAAAGAHGNNMDAAEYKHAVRGLIFLKLLGFRVGDQWWFSRVSINHWIEVCTQSEDANTATAGRREVGPDFRRSQIRKVTTCLV